MTVFFYIMEENMRSVSLVLNVLCFVMLVISLVLDVRAGRQVNIPVRIATLVLLATSIVFNILVILKR